MKSTFLVLGTLLLTSNAAAQNWYDAPRFLVDNSNRSIRLLEDMDGDAFLDLIWIASTSIRVDFQSTNGEFVKRPIYVPDIVLDLPQYNPRTYPQVGDVNGDALKDLVFGLDLPYPKGRVAVFFGLGGGDFADSVIITPPPPPYAYAGSIQSVCLGDVDGDGVLEIAESHDTSVGGRVVDQRSAVTWWNWDGAAFTPSSTLTLKGEVARVTSLVSLDFEGDGIADLATVGYDGSSDFNNYVLLLPTVAGNPTRGAQYSISGSVAELAAADMDSDGDDDFLASHREHCDAFDVALFTNTVGTFSQTNTLNIDVDETYCAWWPHPVLGDWNQDGLVDLFLGERNFHVCENNGNGRFSLIGSFNHERDADFVAYPTGVGDFNRDGITDFVGPRTLFFGDSALPAPLPETLPGHLDHQFTDWEDEGDLDILLRNPGIGTNNGMGIFTALTNLVDLPSIGFYGSAVACGDFNGDGRRDFLVPHFDGNYYDPTFLGMTTLLDDGTGRYIEAGFATKERISTFPLGRLRLAYDIDGDGDEDLPVEDGFWIVDGTTGLFTSFETYFHSSEIADVADFDDDGDADVLALLNAGGRATYTLWIHGPALTFTPQLLVETAKDGLGDRARFIDLDDDQDLDIAIPPQNSTVIATLAENRNGTIMAPIMLNGLIGDTNDIGTGDVDGDGISDLLVGRHHVGFVYGQHALIVYRRDSQGLVFEEGRMWASGDIDVFGDIDGDLDPDAIGTHTLRCRLYSGPADGVIRQYGKGAPGLGGAVPVIGAKGPLRPGATDSSLRIRRARGGALSFLLVGATEANIPGFAGTSLYVNPPFLIFILPLSGPPGDPGAGSFTLHLAPVLDDVAGITFYHQLVVLDDGGTQGSIVASGGLELIYGQ